MHQSENINELATALAKAQSAMKHAERSRENPHFRARYATLEDVWNVCRKPLTENGLSVVQLPGTDDNGRPTLTTMLLHSSGQWVCSSALLNPTKADPQGVGSAITYYRRYGLQGVAGVTAGEEDDDGNAASEAPTPAQTARLADWEQKVVTPKQLAMIFALSEQCGHTAESMKNYIKEKYRRDSSKELTQKEASQLITELKGKV